MIKKCVIFDIDGTLADHRHRLKYIEKDPKDWDSFNKESSKDEPNKWCYHLCRSIFMYANNINVMIITGRSDKCKEITEQWFKENLIPYDHIYMRKEGDFRQDFEVKKEIYEQYIKNKYKVLFVVEDRTQVVEMWRSLDIICLQCHKGDY